MNQSTPEKHNASAARCLGLRSGVGCAPERALLPQPPHPRNGIAPRGQSPALGGVGRDRGALGPRRRPHRWAPYRVLVPGAEPGLPGDCCPGDAAGGSRSDGRARASGRRRGARGGLRAGPRRGAGERGIREGRGPGRGPDNGRARAGPGGGASRRRGGASRGAGTVGKFSQSQLGEALERRRALCALRTPPQILPEPRCSPRAGGAAPGARGPLTACARCLRPPFLPVTRG